MRPAPLSLVRFTAVLMTSSFGLAACGGAEFFNRDDAAKPETDAAPAVSSFVFDVPAEAKQGRPRRARRQPCAAVLGARRSDLSHRRPLRRGRDARRGADLSRRRSGQSPGDRGSSPVYPIAQGWGLRGVGDRPVGDRGASASSGPRPRTRRRRRKALQVTRRQKSAVKQSAARNRRRRAPRRVIRKRAAKRRTRR